MHAKRPGKTGKSIISHLAFAGTLLLPLFASRCGEEDLSNCDQTLPQAKILNVDSLQMVPFSYTHHMAQNGGSQLWGLRTIRLQVSRRDSSNAYIHLDSNGLGLFADGNRIGIPAPGYAVGDGWHCPVYSEWTALDVTGSVGDTSFLLEIRKDSVPVRSWAIAFNFDSAKAPAIRIDSISGGIGIEVRTAPDTRFDEMTFNEDVGRNWGQVLRMEQSGNVISSAIQLKNLSGLQDSRWASEIGDAKFRVCLNSVSGIESITVNGKTDSLQTEFCQELAPAVEDMIRAYLRRRCLDCK